MFRKALMASLSDRMIWFNSFQVDPIYKTIRNTAKALMEMEDYSKDKAWKYAIRKRKYLLDSVLEEFEPQRWKGRNSQNMTMMVMMMISQLVKDSKCEKNHEDILVFILQSEVRTRIHVDIFRKGLKRFMALDIHI